MCHQVWDTRVWDLKSGEFAHFGPNPGSKCVHSHQNVRKSLFFVIFQGYRQKVTFWSEMSEFPVSNPHPGHQFLTFLRMGRTKLPLVILTFLKACIYGILRRTENGAQNRASAVCLKKVENTPESRGISSIFY